MDHAKFLETFRRATVIRWKADVGFATLRAIADELSEERKYLRDLRQNLATYKDDPSHHGSLRQRHQIARMVLEEQMKVDEQAIVVEVLEAMQAEVQTTIVDVFAPQRDAVKKTIDQLRIERDATVRAQVTE